MASENGRNGRLFKIPSLKPAERCKREQSFQVSGPRISIYLPKKKRDFSNYPLGDFKEKLYEYLAGVPDEPKIGGLMPLNFEQSNSLMEGAE